MQLEVIIFCLLGLVQVDGAGRQESFDLFLDGARREGVLLLFRLYLLRFRLHIRRNI